MPKVNYVQNAIDTLADLLPGCDPDLLKLYALLTLTLGGGTRLEDVHDAWAVWRNTTDPNHRSLVPFGDLSLEVQELDRKYMDMIHAAATRIDADCAAA